MTGTEPIEERWAYGGIRVLHAERMHAWLPDSGDGEQLLFRPVKGSYTVGLVYRVFVIRADGRVVMHGWPSYVNRRVERDLAALLRAERYAAQARLALARMKPPPLGRIALDEAIEPVRAIARGLTSRADRTALLGYVVAELSSALPPSSPHREVTGGA
jgi:hypothetical protein